LTKRVQLAGFSTEIEQFLVGLERELRVDLDNDSLRLHDGVKEGGYEFLNRDENDTRYQARTLELDGFNFAAQDKGFLVRISPATYRIRKLTANEGEFAITNPRGTAGDLYFELLGTITTEHTWAAPQVFLSAIDAQAGLDGDTRGLHTGNVIGDVTGFITGGGTGDFSGTFTGDVDVRGHTFQADAGQITGDMVNSDAWTKYGVPVGVIALWSGSSASIPQSWALCDGSNGTPDLRDRFIVGAGGAYAPLAVGGSDSATISGSLAAGGEHSHPVTVGGHALTIAEMPAHSHTVPYMDSGSGSCIENATGAATSTVNTSSVGGGATHTHEGSTTTTSGSHTHDLTLDSASILPPYYALCYIMKTG